MIKKNKKKKNLIKKSKKYLIKIINIKGWDEIRTHVYTKVYSNFQN